MAVRFAFARTHEEGRAIWRAAHDSSKLPMARESRYRFLRTLALVSAPFVTVLLPSTSSSKLELSYEGAQQPEEEIIDEVEPRLTVGPELLAQGASFFTENRPGALTLSFMRG